MNSVAAADDFFPACLANALIGGRVAIVACSCGAGRSADCAVGSPVRQSSATEQVDAADSSAREHRSSAKA